MSSTTTTVGLGEIDPNGSRQLGRRSAVCWADDAVVVGLDDGSIVAIDAETLDERWRHKGPAGSVVSLTAFSDGILAGARDPDGDLRLLDNATGAVRWRYRTADHVGEAQKSTRFFLPFVADIVAEDDCAYVAARRYERDPDVGRTFRSFIYAFEPDGELRWRHETDASPISIDVHDDRVAVAFNRCPGDDGDGVRVFEATDGSVQRRWDPPGDGQRRVGDVSLLDEGVAVASHADYRGYLLNEDDVRWGIDLGCSIERSGETVYAYPNHVHATDAGVVFVTGNTYPEEGRETDARHPFEHAAIGVDSEGRVRWEADVGGFAHVIAADGQRIAVPVAQHFRDCDSSVHGILEFDVQDGRISREPTTGVITAAAIDRSAVAVEEPVAYHDEGFVQGRYRLHLSE